MDYHPIIHKLPHIDDKLFDAGKKDIINFAENGFDYPSLILGFQQYLHAVNVKKIPILKTFEGKKKVYTTMDLFSPYIDNYDAHIENVTVEYFKLQKNKIVNNDFYKFWELLLLLDLGQKDMSKIVSLNGGAFVQALMYFRNEFVKSKKDDFLIIHDELNSSHNKIMNEFLEEYKNIKSIKIENISKKSLGKSISDTNFNMACIDLSVNWEFDINLEQKLLVRLIPELNLLLNVLANDGNLIIKLYETFTQTSGKIIGMLSACFGEIFIVKPMVSTSYTPERFIVCKKYKKSQKILSLLEVLTDELEKNKSLGLLNILPQFKFPDEFKKELTISNTHIANDQYIAMNKVVSFIEGQNYYGDVYTRERNEQVKASTFWINTFYPNKNNLDKNMKMIEKLIK